MPTFCDISFDLGLAVVAIIAIAGSALAQAVPPVGSSEAGRSQSAAIDPAHAKEKERARALIRDASTLFESGHPERAGELYDEAYRILEGAGLLAKPELLFNAGLAYERGGACDLAADRFGRFAQMTPSARSFPDFLERLERARRCAPEVDIVTVPPGAKVSVDGVSQGVTPARMRLKAGAHSLQLELEGFAAKTEPFTIQEGTALALRSELVPIHAGGPARTEPAVKEVALIDRSTEIPPHTPTPHIEPGRSDGWLWVSGAVGALALASGSVLFALERKAVGTVESELEKDPSLRDSMRARDAAGDATRFGVGARLGLGVAGAALLASGMLALLDAPPGAGDSEATGSVSSTRDGPIRAGASLSVEW